MPTITQQDISTAALHIRQGHLVAFPTETVYGLGANACDDAAVLSIFATKGRPAFNPLIVHVSKKETAFSIGVFNTLAQKMAHAFWPGPLTLVVPYNHASPINISEHARAFLPTIAIRVPHHPIALALIEASNTPIAAPSANVSGQLSCTTASDVVQSFSGQTLKPAYILDGGACAKGLESTIIGFDSNENPVLLRKGAIPITLIEQTLGVTTPIIDNTSPMQQQDDSRAIDNHKKIISPGQLLRHYAPLSRLCINSIPTASTIISPYDYWLCFGATTPEHFYNHPHVRQLSKHGNMEEAAHNLFTMLHELDTLAATHHNAYNKATIYVMPIPNDGIGFSTNDRLIRASQTL